MECGITNLGECIPGLFFDFIMNIINAPLQVLLSFIKTLLISPINLELFASLWAIVIYVISLFYGILMFYSGFNFLISGHDIIRREKAKELFRNIFLIIILVQASYFIYEMFVEMSGLLASAVIDLIDDSFFLLTTDNITNIGLQFLFSFVYVLILLLTVIILTFRYLIVAVGVVFIPIAVFLYFIPPLNAYGKLIFNFLGICIFISFFDALIFLVCAQLLEVSIFANFKILVMISAFLYADILMLYLMLFSAIKSAINATSKSGKVIASIAQYFT